MERREFLKAGALAAIPGGTLGQTGAKPKITTSVMLWTLKGTFEEKLAAAAAAGCQSVELVAEHIHWSDAAIAEMKQRARTLGLGMDTLIATPDWKRRGMSIVDPAKRDGFLKDVEQAITFARKLEIPQIILMSGDEIPGRSREEQWASLLEGCRRAGDLAAKAGLTMIVEPLNAKINHKDFFLTTCVDGLKLVKEVDNPHVRLLFDIYHEQVQFGNVIRTLKEATPHVAVFHVADNPGRNDPGTGEMNYPNIYRAIRETGFSGYCTMEYLPLGDQTQSLTRAVRDMQSIVAA